MKCIFVLSSLLLLSTAFSQQLLLDDIMSTEDQKSAGVAYLTPNQRIALEQWMNKHCNCPSEKSVSEEKNQGLFMSINIDNGKEIQLNDNSIWEVDPRDYAISEAWLTSFPIKIIPSDDPEYPFLLVNKITGVGIKVRKGVAPRPTPMTPPPTPGPATTTPATPHSAPPNPAGQKPAAPNTPPSKTGPAGSVPMPAAPKPTVTPPPTIPPSQAPPPMGTPPPPTSKPKAPSQPKPPPQVP
jgi:hypothetical protein